jgi:hypothetical protein
MLRDERRRHEKRRRQNKILLACNAKLLPAPSTFTFIFDLFSIFLASSISDDAFY